MIQPNSTHYSVLPWYNSIELQNHRRSYAFGAVYPLFAPANKLLPFQILRLHSTAQIASVVLYTKEGAEVADITTQMKDAGLAITSFADYGWDAIVFPGRLPMALNMLDGQYYCTLSDGGNTWYSEVFTIVQDTEPYLLVEWWDDNDMITDAGIISYVTPAFRNRLYLNTELGKPDYSFEEDGETRDGYFFPEKQVSEKTYKCTILAPEYLCDVMRLIRMADHVRLRDKYGRVYVSDTFLITPKWQTQGDLASVEIEFTTDTAVKHIGRGYSRVTTTSGDFNDDFSNDYNNQQN